jgi:ribose-phosphate pyrophosphokinase
VALGAEFISKKFVSDAVVLTPDAGGLKRAKSFYEYYHNFNNLSSFAIMLKYRSRPNEVGSVNLLGDISGKDCIIVDDMIDTGVRIFKFFFTIFRVL